MKIVITGSLGHIGKPLAQLLINNGHLVTVITTKGDRIAAIEALGGIAAIGSVEDPEFLTEVCKGAHALFTMVPPNFTEVDQVAYYRRVALAYKQAVVANQVPRVVNLSSYGAHLHSGTGFILGAHHTEIIMNQLADTSVTHIRAGYFYYNLFGFMEMLHHHNIIGSNYGGDDQMILVSPLDIAHSVAEELEKQNSVPIRYVISDTATANEVAGILGETVGKPGVNWLVFSNEDTYNALLQKFPKHIAQNFVELGACMHSGTLTEDYFLQNIPPDGSVTLVDFAQEFAKVYKANFSAE